MIRILGVTVVAIAGLLSVASFGTTSASAHNDGCHGPSDHASYRWRGLLRLPERRGENHSLQWAGQISRPDILLQALVRRSGRAASRSTERNDRWGSARGTPTVYDSVDSACPIEVRPAEGGIVPCSRVLYLSNRVLRFTELFQS